MAQTPGLGRARVEEVIDHIGLQAVARKRRRFLLGMGQRLGIAVALLGDPVTVILDEPANGLDPEGIVWIRNLLRGFAADGRAVFVSSHPMDEIAQMAEHEIVVGRGRLIADTTVEDLVARASVGAAVCVRAADPATLRDRLAAQGATIETSERAVLEVHGLSSEHIGEIAMRAGIVLHELTPMTASLEEAFMRPTRDAVSTTRPAGPPRPPTTWRTPRERGDRHCARAAPRPRDAITRRALRVDEAVDSALDALVTRGCGCGPGRPRTAGRGRADAEHEESIRRSTSHRQARLCRP
jgi:energy-coupling factor transporter ATP-binding protein EcfA2